jgi:hypothetical protein
MNRRLAICAAKFGLEADPRFSVVGEHPTLLESQRQRKNEESLREQINGGTSDLRMKRS